MDKDHNANDEQIDETKIKDGFTAMMSLLLVLGWEGSFTNDYNFREEEVKS